MSDRVYLSDLLSEIEELYVLILEAKSRDWVYDYKRHSHYATYLINIYNKELNKYRG